MTDPFSASDGCTCFSLRKLTRTVTRLYDSHLAEVGLKTTQYSLLKGIAFEPLPIAELAARVNIERTTLTRNLKPLIEAGWVKLQSGADSRQRIVVITGTGQDKVEAARQVWRHAQTELEQKLGWEVVRDLHIRVDTVLTQLAPLFDEDLHALAH